MAATSPCPCCETVAVGAPDGHLDLAATQANLEGRVADGRMRVLAADVPLEEMVDLLVADTKYTIVTFLGCLVCGRTIFWGLCIRGRPVYRHDSPDAPSTYRWEPGYPTVEPA
ncbi:hypothetical protein [Nocardioides lianchengensis]|uniref:Uncharacterized protein n=1 Tax=Nocardioides lianchengensis TaxID=1045774 RepID=A0A1G6JFB6_9ACTN|nr:hypothetical protein [Nocardioides lianchengensis]NYG12762.1 hypothetical protein [Nocardioides lianchengensis]SDC17357.1 hypothetical protein SAMN05421872_101465 [Nocardioides lianchengensis]